MKKQPRQNKTKKRKVKPMAIVKSKTGSFYDVDDNVLEGKEVKREDLPKEMQSGAGQQSGPGPGGMPGLIQIIVHSPQGAPRGDKPAEGEGDVAGHHMHWSNCWRNCWRNCGW